MNYICLIDCNNFFTSCEKIFHPRLKKLPLVVVSGKGGIVIARSNEAKKLGVPMGAASFKYKSLFIKENVIVKNTNFSLYIDISRRIREVVQTFSFPTFIYSIDEMFIQIPKESISDQLLENIQKKIKQWVGIDVSLGVSLTKTLAKIATNLAKKKLKNRKLLIDNLEIESELKTFKVEDIWGIGNQSKKKLSDYSIFTAENLLAQNEQFIRKMLGIQGVRISNELKGVNSYPLAEKNPEKSLQITKTFPVEIIAIEKINQIISSFIVEGCEKLRKIGKESSYFSIFLESSRFKKNQDKMIKGYSLNEPSNYTPDFLKIKEDILSNLMSGDILVKRAGIQFSILTDKKCRQKNLFINSDPKHKNLMTSIDMINHLYGDKSITFLSDNYYSNKKTCSLRCTTDWDELITVTI